MPTSMPASAVRDTAVGGTRVVDPGVGRPSAARLALLNTLSRVTMPAVAHVPDPVKRVLLGRRTVTVDGNTLDTTLQFVLAAQRTAGVNGLLASDDVTVARRQLRTLSAIIDVEVAVGVREVDVPGPAGALRARHYTPVNAADGHPPLLVFFHGGGFVVGDLDTHDGLCRLICRDAGMHVLSVDYRLAPEDPAPAAAQDCLAAYRWAVAHADDLGADPRRIAVGGDSAGGNLAAVVCQRVRAEADVPAPALQFLIYPATNFAGETRSKTLFSEGFFLTKRHMDWFQDTYLSGDLTDPADPAVSPLLADDLTGLPPALVLTAGFDPLRDEGEAYARALSVAGVAVDYRCYGPMIHGFANFVPLGGGAVTAMADAISALQAHLTRC